MESKQVHIYQTTPEQLTESILKGVDSKLKEFFEKQKPSKEDEELLTRKEASKILNCSVQTLWNWSNNGNLSSYRIGNRVYYKKSDIYSKLIKQE